MIKIFVYKCSCVETNSPILHVCFFVSSMVIYEEIQDGMISVRFVLFWKFFWHHQDSCHDKDIKLPVYKKDDVCQIVDKVHICECVLYSAGQTYSKTDWVFVVEKTVISL